MSTTNPSGERARVFDEALEAYRSGQHYEAHELWEELWQDEEDDVHRRFLQALIQLASAVHKATHDVGPRGAVRLLDRAHERLDGLGQAYGGIDVGRLRDAIVRYRDAVETALAAGRLDAAAPFVPPIETG